MLPVESNQEGVFHWEKIKKMTQSVPADDFDVHIFVLCIYFI